MSRRQLSTRRLPAAAAARRRTGHLLAARRDRRGALRRRRPADEGRDGSLLLPDQAQELHSARISLPHRVRRGAARQAAAGHAANSRRRASGCRSARRASTCRASGSARPCSAPGPRTIDRGRSGGQAQLAACAPAAARCSSSTATEVGWMAPYGRNLEADRGFRGRAEGRRQRDPHLVRRSRRARCALLFPARLPVAAPTAEPGAAGRRSTPQSPTRWKRRSTAMHFERPAYRRRRGGAGHRRSRCRSMPSVEIAIEGDFMSIEADAVASSRLACRRPDAPAVCRYRGSAGRFPPFQGDADASADSRASRVFGVEICHADRQGAAPATLAARIDEALRRGRRTCRGRTQCRGAGAAGDRADAARETDAMIAGDAAGDRGLPRLRRLHPGAAALVPRRPMASDIAPALRRAHRRGHPRLPLLDG